MVEKTDEEYMEETQYWNEVAKALASSIWESRGN